MASEGKSQVKIVVFMATLMSLAREMGQAEQRWLRSGGEPAESGEAWEAYQEAKAAHDRYHALCMLEGAEMSLGRPL